MTSEFSFVTLFRNIVICTRNFVLQLKEGQSGVAAAQQTMRHLAKSVRPPFSSLCIIYSNRKELLSCFTSKCFIL